jgi:Xaa-Pro aminopeptidase
VPHSTGDDTRVLRAGQSLVVDLFPRDRLFADTTRTFCVGPPPADLLAAHELVRRAVELAESAARPGVSGWHLQQRVCRHFEAEGWPTPTSSPGTERGYVHGLGHGVGAELHELPTFKEHDADGEGILDVGDVLTLEPGLYEPAPATGAGWGVRLEDTYRVTTDGVESLTPMPRDLDPRAWLAAHH